jgi:glycosyltransferase involved in cell wall biosynthesis
VSPTYRVHLLPSSGYARNVSLARIVDHRQIGRAFLRHAGDFARPDLLVISMPTIDLAYAGARYAVKRRVPFILDLRDLWPDIFYLDRPFPQKQIIQLLKVESSRRLNWALRHAGAVVGITDEFVAWGCKRSGRERTRDDIALPLAYRAAEPPSAAEVDEQRRMTGAGILRPDLFQVCFLGSISPRMDLGTLCEAGARARIFGLPLHLVIAGTGEALEGLKSAYAATNVRFLGWVNQTAIRAILRTSKAGAVPYRNSIDFQMSIPNKAIEYLSHGVPILTCLRGTLARLVEGEAVGATYSEGGVETLLDRVKAYFDDGKRLALHSANALNVFSRRFSTDVVFGEYVGLVRRLASGGRPA